MAGAGRVVAGSARGIGLAAPGSVARPLADRAKEAVFAILEPILPGAWVLDLCAGSGAAGIEALSRGAVRVVFVDRDAAAVRAIRENLRRTGLADAASVIRRDAVAATRGLAGEAARFDLVIVDPPYAETNLRATILAALGAPDSPLAPGATVIATGRWRSPAPERAGLLRSTRSRRFGETLVTFYRFDPGAVDADAAPGPVA